MISFLELGRAMGLQALWDHQQVLAPTLMTNELAEMAAKTLFVMEGFKIAMRRYEATRGY
jgi:hypothetical protein